MGWKNWEVDLTLLQYHGAWYQTHDNMRESSVLMANFNVVIEVTGGEFNVLKNRLGMTGNGTFTDLFRMQLFTTGKTFDDLPTFTMCHRSCGAGTVIGYKDNGDLFEYPVPTRTL